MIIIIKSFIISIVIVYRFLRGTSHFTRNIKVKLRTKNPAGAYLPTSNIRKSGHDQIWNVKNLVIARNNIHDIFTTHFNGVYNRNVC